MLRIACFIQYIQHTPTIVGVLSSCPDAQHGLSSPIQQHAISIQILLKHGIKSSQFYNATSTKQMRSLKIKPAIAGFIF